MRCKRFSFVNTANGEILYGFFHYMRLNKIIDMKIRNNNGYLVIADDMLSNFWQEKSLCTSFCGNFHKDNWAWWKKLEWEMSQVLNEILRCYIDDIILKNLKVISFHSFSPNLLCLLWFWYIPQRFERKYQQISQFFFRLLRAVLTQIPLIFLQKCADWEK